MPEPGFEVTFRFCKTRGPDFGLAGMQSFYWFRTNLRLTDNPSFAEACDLSDFLLPFLFIPADLDRWGESRLRFWLESVQDLTRQLEAKGSRLLILKGSPLEGISGLFQQLGTGALFYEKAVAWNEVQEEKAVKELAAQHKVRIQEFDTAGLYPAVDLPFTLEKLPQVFTQFRIKVEAGARVVRPEPAPVRFPPLPENAPVGEKLPEPKGKVHPKSVLPFKGGETAAWERLRHYFGPGKFLSRYKETRNGLLGGDYSSKLAPWLALGCISARSVYQEIKLYESRNGANDSTYWLFFELLWREYFRWLALQHGRKIFLPGGIQGKVPAHYHNPRKFEAWCQGETGESFVDANMRELLHTGFMSNRGRQNVASFLVHDLRLDWRLGADWFERQLIDYDAASNWGNWTYVAGVGNDPREGRRFNIQRQSDTYDPKGEYQRFWLGK